MASKENYIKKIKSKAKASFNTKWMFFKYWLAFQQNQNVDVEAFQKFDLSNDKVEDINVIDSYCAFYCQIESHDKILDIDVNTIYTRMKGFELENEDLKADCLVDYKKMFQALNFQECISELACCYCKITIEKLEELSMNFKIFKKRNRGWSLEIERYHPNFEYTPDNVGLACHWCNNAKTDEFDVAEFKKIGNVIAEIWEARKDKNWKANYKKP